MCTRCSVYTYIIDACFGIFHIFTVEKQKKIIDTRTKRLNIKSVKQLSYYHKCVKILLILKMSVFCGATVVASI